ncbi:hypothetical protein DRW03_14230 [Corallococcus sp. H22C18031201]|uniref:hypothetical protein n=1 Tax=Citreicoccus inhibens TaxID=2849499 RepID=UPI000E71241F|nr:hypothetical protein [Citreicoccus inhibens]MBU8895499.1 hypothetical protein [Citreicoccus inhibens]RJS22472.1 hypothetical protein DRW03_14230 [Corallococcus sp. H22C18031201]
MRIPLLLGVLLMSGSGCIVARPGGPVVVHRPGPSRPPPPPPSRPSAMSYDEAVNLGWGQCRSRGYDCQLQEAHLTGNNVWKVKFRAFAPGGKGHLHLDYDAYSRSLLRVDDKVKGRGDWDDDDDDHGRGRGKKRGHAKWDD